MKRWKLYTLIGVVAVVITVTVACIHMENQSESRMYTLAAALKKLSKTVETTPSVTGDELLNQATKRDPALLAPFKEYTVKVLRQDKHSAVMICDKKKNTALLEDTGCTAKLDLHHWRENSGSACEFTLSLAKTCIK